MSKSIKLKNNIYIDREALTKPKVIWSGNEYTIGHDVSVSNFESGKLYIFEVYGLSGSYKEYIPFISNGSIQYVQYTMYDGSTNVRWRIELTSNTFKLNNNSINMGSNTAILNLYKC